MQPVTAASGDMLASLPEHVGEDVDLGRDEGELVGALAAVALDVDAQRLGAVEVVVAHGVLAGHAEGIERGARELDDA